MKICAAQAMIALLVCGISMANTGYSQLLDKEITINLSDVTFEEALIELSNTAKVKFAYSLDQLKVKQNVTIEVSRTPLRRVLDDLLTPFRIRYKVHDSKEIIFLKRQSDRESDQSAIEPKQLGIAPRQLTGMVTDVYQQPMAGVNVFINGTTIGTTTDSNGKFVISADEGDVLVFSFIGYTRMEVQVHDQPVIEVVLIEDIKSLSEIVVNAGYWEIDKKENTGNIAKVTGKEIEKQPVANVMSALQGRMSGVVITPNTGIPGGALNIQIRGQNSLRTEGNYPLYIIDGVPIDSRPTQSFAQVFFKGIDPINTINPSNIESIEILKDADATAIYGSRGANGVVLITTKRAKKGKSSLDVQMYQGIGHVTQRMDLLTTQDYLAMRMEALKNDGWLPFLENPVYDNLFPDLKIWDQEKETDWQGELFGGTANITDAQLSYSAGNAATSFRFGGGIHRETTVFPGDFSYMKATAHLNLNHSALNNRLNISVSLNYGNDNNDQFSRNIVYDALTLAPNAGSLTPSGELDWAGYDFNRPNPLSYFKVSHNNKTSGLITNAIITYNIIKGLNLKANLGYTDSGSKEVINTPKISMVPGSTAPRKSTFGITGGSSWIIEPQLSYEKEFVSSRFTAFVGTTWQSSNTSSQWIAGSGYVSDELLGNINAAPQVSNLGASDIEYRYNAAFGRIAYSVQDKYFINLTGRRDGSSRFGKDNKFANFGSVGIAWVFSREGSLQNAGSYFSFGKLRTSYGTTGSDQIADYGYLSTYSASPVNYQGQSVLLPDGPDNPNFAWEVNKKLEIGLDLGFVEDKLSLSLSWYRNRSTNQLVGYTLPATTGFGSVQANLDATVQNTGLEIEALARILNSEKLKWSSSLNFTLPRNKLIAYPNIEGSSYANTYVVGEPLSILKLYHLNGVDPATGNYQFEDMDGDGKIDVSDMQDIVNVGRRYYGGFTNSLSLKSFELSFLIDFVKQSAADYHSIFLEAPGRMVNQPASILSKSRWSDTGNVAEIQKFTNNNAAYDRLRSSNANISDASFLRFRTLSLSCDISGLIARKSKFANAIIYVQAQNLWTFTKYKGLDPEMPGSAQLPQLRVITAGIKFQF